ncbi:MAG: aldehyde dehydrogenase [Rhodococcus sp. (in: high G+C Gram-positive bacteria)]
MTGNATPALQMYVSGTRIDAHSQIAIDVVDPAFEKVIGQIADGDETDVDRAVRAADDALAGWSSLAPGRRGEYLRAIADEFERRIDEMSELVSRQNGTPITLAKAMQSVVPGNYRYFASLADDLHTREERTTVSGDAIITREPVGVVGAIVPWNGPQPLIAWKLGPALAAGCTVVIKPAPETSLDAFLLAEVFDTVGLPPGVVNIVTGGRGTGAALVAHPKVRKVAFTGSAVAGKAIAAECGAGLKYVTLELGGKSAGILLDDVDLDAFTPFVLSACTPNTGQTCRALTRVLAPRARYDEVVDFLAATLRGIPLGDPSDPSNLYGPLVNAAQRERVENYVRIGVDEGAEIVTGGGRPDGFDTGYYVEPTLFRDVTNDMRIAREEIFGPVVVVIPYDSVDEAIDIANDSEYGLGGGVFSPDVERATAVAERIVSGTVGVNTATFPMDAPFGGIKDSGLGAELGPGALDAYLTYKTIFRA